MEPFEDGLFFGLLQVLSLLDEGVDLVGLYYFVGVLYHDLLVHLFDVVLEVAVVVGDGAHLLLVFLQLKLVIVFYGLHVLGVLQVLHQLPFDPLNYGLLVLQLLLQVYLLALVLALVLGELVYLHLRLED